MKHLNPIGSCDHIICIEVSYITNHFKRAMNTCILKIRVEYGRLDFEDNIFCVLSERVGDEWEELGRTEVVPNSSKARWDTSFDVHYDDNKDQMVKFELYKENLASDRLRRRDLLDSTKTLLMELVGIEKKSTRQIGQFRIHTSRPDGANFVRATAMEVLTSFAAIWSKRNWRFKTLLYTLRTRRKQQFWLSTTLIVNYCFSIEMWNVPWINWNPFEYRREQPKKNRLKFDVKSN